MIYLFVIPASPKDYLLWFIAGMVTAILFVLRFEYSTSHRYPGSSFVIGMLGILTWCGWQVAIPFGPYEAGSEHFVYGIIAAVSMVFAAYFLIQSFRHTMQDYGLAPYYGDGRADADDFRILKYDLNGGNEERVIDVLMQDARARDQMDRYDKLSMMRQSLYEKEMLANQDPSKKGDLYYQKYFFRKELEEILDKNVRRS